MGPLTQKFKTRSVWRLLIIYYGTCDVNYKIVFGNCVVFFHFLGPLTQNPYDVWDLWPSPAKSPLWDWWEKDINISFLIFPIRFDLIHEYCYPGILLNHVNTTNSLRVLNSGYPCHILNLFFLPVPVHPHNSFRTLQRNLKKSPKGSRIAASNSK